MKGQLFRKIALAGVIFIVFALLIAFRSRVLVPVAAVQKDQNGICDLNGVDFEKEIAELPSDFDWYGGKLFTPEDFESGMTPDPAIYNLTENAAEIPYGTYRIVLKCEADRSYLMTGYSVDYSTRIWCGDEILTEIGKVSSDPGESEPRILYFTVPVTSDSDGLIKLTVQYSNFVRNEGGGISSFHLGSAKNINWYNNCQIAEECIISGGFIILAMYFMLKYFTEERKDQVFIALCCLLSAVRSQRFYLTFLTGPEYNWFIHYRIIVLNAVLMECAFFYVIHYVSGTTKINGAWCSALLRPHWRLYS